MQAYQRSAALVALPLGPGSAQVMLLLEPCSAHAVQLANRNLIDHIPNNSILQRLPLHYTSGGAWTLSQLNHCPVEKDIPDQARKWIQSFMTNWRVCIKFDGYTSPLSQIKCPCLPQGSPLPSVLFIFRNSALVDQAVDSKDGASAYIDDYFRLFSGRERPSLSRN